MDWLSRALAAALPVSAWAHVATSLRMISGIERLIRLSPTINTAMPRHASAMNWLLCALAAVRLMIGLRGAVAVG
jgi:hypothetical protein